MNTGHNGGADPLVRSRPPGRLVAGGKRLIFREKSGSRGTRADQGVRPTIYAEPAPLRKLSGIAQKCVRYGGPKLV
jgi:hypothetical protein